MERPLLNNPDVKPSAEIIEAALGKSYNTYAELISIVSGEKYGIEPQWNYYRDGKAWLCKAGFKKKTIFWLSAWDGFFKITFYFTEKNCPAVYNLDIDSMLIDEFRSNAFSGKLKPLTVMVKSQGQLHDILKIAELKKRLG